jgi:hypothetical protein
MRSLILVLLIATSVAARAEEKRLSREALDAQLIRAEPSFWFGYRLRKGDATVGPGVFASGLSDAVRGSTAGERHARHARIWSGFAFGFGINTLAFLAASVGVYAQNHFNNNDTAAILLGTAAVSFALEALSTVEREQEVMLSISAYNHDLIRF